MKIRVQFKSPDAVDDCVKRAIEKGDISQDLEYEANEACKKWVEFGECITVEIDTEKGTCVGVPL